MYKEQKFQPFVKYYNVRNTFGKYKTNCRFKFNLHQKTIYPFTNIIYKFSACEKRQNFLIVRFAFSHNGQTNKWFYACATAKCRVINDQTNFIWPCYIRFSKTCKWIIEISIWIINKWNIYVSKHRETCQNLRRPRNEWNNK